MKFFSMRELLRVWAFVLALTFMTALPSFAQNTNNANSRGADRTETTRTVERDDDTDWGWLGLLGLLGLAGLIPKKRRVEVQEFRDTNRPATGAGTQQ